MFKVMLVCMTFAIGAIAHAADTKPEQVVDLRDAQSLETLQRNRPDHYEKIRRVIAALREEPRLAEGNWLQVNVDARDVDLSRLFIRTSYPPKQVLQFTLDDTRYLMHLVRADMAAEVVPAK